MLVAEKEDIRKPNNKLSTTTTGTAKTTATTATFKTTT